METIQQKEIVGKADCRHCEGRGYYFAQNGEDDYDIEICDCVMEENEV